MRAFPRKSFQTSWKTTNVLPVPVAMRSSVLLMPLANRHIVPVNGHLLVWPDLFPGDLIFVPRGFKCRSPFVPVDVVAETLEDVSRGRRSGERFIIAGFVVGQDVFDAVAGNRETQPETIRIT